MVSHESPAHGEEGIPIMRRNALAIGMSALTLTFSLSCSSAKDVVRTNATTPPQSTTAAVSASAAALLPPEQAAALGAALAHSGVKDAVGVALPPNWPANLPRPTNTALVLTSATPAATKPPAGDWALFVAPGVTADAATAAYRAQLEAVGLKVVQSLGSYKGYNFPELSIAVSPAARVRLIQTDGGVAVVVGLIQ